MSWIEEISAADATGELQAIYDELLAKRGKVSNIMQAQSLNPGAMHRHLDLYMQLLFGRSKLSRAEREAIAVVTSATNRCDYCVSHHAEALRRFEKDPGRVEAIIAGDYDGPGRGARMLDYAARLTRDPDAITRDDIEALREAGFSDAEILDINLVTSYFNFVNRVALGLGVSFTPDEVGGYKS